MIVLSAYGTAIKVLKSDIQGLSEGKWIVSGGGPTVTVGSGGGSAAASVPAPAPAPVAAQNSIGSS